MNEKLNILVIGSGGREHAMVHALLRSPSAGVITCSPGSDAIAQHAPCVELKTRADVVAFAKAQQVDLVIVGPEQPLVDGWTDSFPIQAPKSAHGAGNRRRDCVDSVYPPDKEP